MQSLRLSLTYRHCRESWSWLNGAVTETTLHVAMLFIMAFTRVEDVLRQQLKSSRPELKKSHKMNKQLLRQVGKLQEQIQAITKLQELMAERQLKELNDDRPSSRRHDNMDAAVGPADDAKHSMLCVFMICCVSLRSTCFRSSFPVSIYC